MSDEKRVFEGVLTRFDEGWIIPEVNIGREDVIEMLEEFDGKAVRLTIEPLPVAHSSKADEICPVAKKPHPVYSMTYGCNLCGKTVWGDGHTMEYPPPKEWLETPPGPVADDSNGGSP